MLTPDSITPEQAARFWSKVDRSGGPDACWPWTACRTPKGYGQVRAGYVRVYAHRLAYTLTTATIPSGEFFGTTCVCHNCDNPGCCNPAHLWLGSVADNNADRSTKGRNGRGRAFGERNGSRMHPETRPRGERNGLSKLTDAAIPSIRMALARGESPGSIARRFGVSCSTIRNIAIGRTWKHVP